MQQHVSPSVDVAVIGGGLAGLTAAATAARGGASVVVLEARTLGGRARSVQRSGFFLNVGGHALYRGAGGWAVLEGLGIRPSGVSPRVDTYRTVWNGEIAQLPVRARTVLSSPLLGVRSKAKLGRWFSNMKRLADSAAPVTFAEWLVDRRAPDDLRKYLLSVARLVTYAAEPEHLPAGVVLAQLAVDDGVAYLHGGWQQIVDALTGAAVAAGAEVIEHAPVDGVSSGDDRWTVAVGDREIAARSIVFATGGPRLAASLLGDDPSGWVERAGPVQRAACLDVGGGRGEVDFLLSADEPLYLSLHAPVADLAPAGQSLYSLMRYLASDDPLNARANRDALEAHATLAGLPRSVDRSIDRLLASPVVTSGSPQVGIERPTGLELAHRGVFAAGDWVGPKLLADASIVSGSNAGVAAARHAMVTT